MVTRGRWLVLAAAVGTILCIALLVLVARSGEVARNAGERAVRPTVRADLRPRTHRFGEIVLATVELVVSSESLEVDTVVATAGRASGAGRDGSGPIGAFDPYEVVDAPTRTVEQSGSLTAVRYTLRLRCVSAECLPDGDSKEFEFPAPSFVWSTEAPPGRRFADRQLDQRRAGGSWPTLTVVSGIRAAELDESGWRSVLVTLPAATARVSPRRLEAGLLGGAGVLVIAAAALLGLVVRRDLRRRESALVLAEAPPAPLEQALRLVEAMNGDGDERRGRIALETLATELRSANRSALADDAERLAWDEELPQPEAVAELARSARGATAGGPP